MNTNIRSKECAWHQSEIKLLGRVIKGLRGFEFHKAIEKEPLYGAGQHALDLQEGNISCDGSITVLGFELDQLNLAANAAGYQDITEVPHEAITITAKFQKTKADKKTFVTVLGIGFTELTHAMEQNAKSREVQLPFVAMDIVSTTV